VSTGSTTAPGALPPAEDVRVVSVLPLEALTGNQKHSVALNDLQRPPPAVKREHPPQIIEALRTTQWPSVAVRSEHPSQVTEARGADTAKM